MSAQLVLAFDPLEPRVLPEARWPFWTLNVLEPSSASPGHRMRQEVHRLSDMEYVLRNCRKDRDAYVSQAFFARPARRALNIHAITHGFVDLDVYKIPAGVFHGDPRRHAAQALRTFCRDEGIPQPSLIVFSGRGVYCKWMWSAPLPRSEVGRSVAVNRALVHRFAAWGADPACVDATRILRVVGTTNTKSGERAEIIWQEQADGQIVTYDFDSFADEILPYTREQVQGFRAATAAPAQVQSLDHARGRRRAREAAEQTPRGRKGFSPESWCWGVVEDVLRLAELRYQGGIVQPGARAMFGHLAAVQLAHVVPAGQLWGEVQQLARVFLPDDYLAGGSRSEFAQHCSTLLQKARAGTVYTYRAATLIQRLAITPAEMALMTRLIDADEKRRRDREATTAARRAAGMLARPEYEAQRAALAADRAARAAALRAGGLTWAEVAQRMELASPDAARFLAARAG